MNAWNHAPVRRQRSPFFFDSVLDDVDRFLNGHLIAGAEAAPNATAFLPTYEMNEDEKGYRLSFDLPGVPRAEIQVEVKDQQLRVFGERKTAKPEEGARQVTERRYGRFERIFTLPTNVDLDKIEAHHEDGVLTLTLPKAEKAQPRTIKIGGAN